MKSCMKIDVGTKIGFGTSNRCVNWRGHCWQHPWCVSGVWDLRRPGDRTHLSGAHVDLQSSSRSSTATIFSRKILRKCCFSRKILDFIDKSLRISKIMVQLVKHDPSYAPHPRTPPLGARVDDSGGI